MREQSRYTGKKEDLYYKEALQSSNYGKALQLFKMRKYKEAKIYFQELLKSEDSKYMEKGRFYLGKIYKIQYNYEKAEEMFKECIQMQKRNIYARVELGMVYAEQGRYEEAEKMFRECIQINKRNIPARNELGRLYAEQGRYKEAEKMFTECIQIDEEYMRARVELGKLYAQQEKYGKAEEILQECINIDKENVYARVELGRVYAEQGKYGEAEEILQECINIDEKNVYAKVELGRVYVKQKKYEKAEETFNEVIEMDKNNKNCIPARTELGRLYVEQGRYEEAEKLFRECIEMDKGNKKSIPARNELALLYVQKGDYQKAKKMFSKISKLEKNNSRKKVEPKSKEEEENEIAEIFNKQIEEPTLEDEDILGKIRAKIHKGDISEAEIAEIERIKDTLEERQYNLIKIAIYEKLRMNKKALEIIKELEEKGQKDRVTNEIKERLKSKKIKAYDLGKWDEIIGWAQVAEVPEDGEIVLSEDKQVENENDEESIQGETIKKNLPEGVKNAIKEIMKKYYVKMQPQVGNNQERSKYIKRYDKLEILLETEEANKRAKMELMLMLVNEGYANIVKEKYPEEYEFIREVINQYKTKKIEAKEAIKKIDEYCI